MEILFLFLVLCVGVASSHAVINDQTKPNYGSVLFENRENCFTEYHKSLLEARIQVEKLFPTFHGLQLQNDPDFTMLMQYFYKISKMIQRMSFVANKNVAKSAFYDTLGGYLKSYIIPKAKISFYSGNITLHTVRELFDLYEKCKVSLDTKGLGWVRPQKLPQPFALPLYLESDTIESECSDLLMLDEQEGELEDDIIALPRLEYDDFSNTLTNIWLPFRRKHVYNLRTKQSAFILMKYFIVSGKCYDAEKLSAKEFYRKLERWIRINVIPHLNDERLYAGFGGILRVQKTLKEKLNDTGPLIPVIKVGEKKNQNQLLRRQLTYAGLLAKKREEDYDYDKVFDNSTDETQFKGQFHAPLFTKNMVWITVFSVMGVLLVVLIFVLMRRCVTRKQRDMRNIPVADPPSSFKSFGSCGKSRSERNSKSYLARKQLPPTTSSGISLDAKPKQTVSTHDERKQRSFKQPRKYNEDLQVNLNSESEDEIFDIKNIVETKDLTKSDSDFFYGNSLQKCCVTNETKIFPKNETTPKIKVEGTVDVKMLRTGKTVNKLRKSLFPKGSSKSVETIEKSKPIVHKRYHLESSAWETVND